MKPLNIKTKILLDSASASDTDIVLHILGFLDGQTTNPTLLAKHHDLKYLWPLTSEALWDFYKSETTRISKTIPDGEVSVEVFADENSKAEDLVRQGMEISTWFPNYYVKLPIIKAGLEAAEQLVKNGIKLNMTLCFSQEQALAVHLAALGANKNQVVISPFLGRLDDSGFFGLDLVKNILKMYKDLKSNVRVLSASIRTAEQLSGALYLKTDLITVPRSLLENWAERNFLVKECDDRKELAPIEYRSDILVTKKWTEVNYQHELTDKGLTRFVSDWKALIK